MVIHGQYIQNGQTSNSQVKIQKNHEGVCIQKYIDFYIHEVKI